VDLDLVAFNGTGPSEEEGALGTVIVRANRQELIQASPVFSAMLEGGWSALPVPFDATVVKVFLEVIHDGDQNSEDHLKFYSDGRFGFDLAFNICSIAHYYDVTWVSRQMEGMLAFEFLYMLPCTEQCGWFKSLLTIAIKLSYDCLVVALLRSQGHIVLLAANPDLQTLLWTKLCQLVKTADFRSGPLIPQDISDFHRFWPTNDYNPFLSEDDNKSDLPIGHDYWSFDDHEQCAFEIHASYDSFKFYVDQVHHNKSSYHDGSYKVTDAKDEEFYEMFLFHQKDVRNESENDFMKAMDTVMYNELPYSKNVYERPSNNPGSWIPLSNGPTLTDDDMLLIKIVNFKWVALMRKCISKIKDFYPNKPEHEDLSILSTSVKQLKAHCEIVERILMKAHS
jgi:hypothetical protein